jgi:hypothetical protein
MIKKIDNFLNEEELRLAHNYWLVREPSLEACGQCNDSVAVYADALSEMFLKTKKSLVEKAFGEELLPTYSFSRMYYKGGELKRHSDRPSCEVSVTLNIFADNINWPIWFHKLDMSKPTDPNTTNYVEDPNAKPISLITKPGSAAAYEGCAYSHWREPYSGEKCMQVFLHYVRAKGRYTSFAMDGRKYFGQHKQQAIKNVWAQ